MPSSGRSRRGFLKAAAVAGAAALLAPRGLLAQPASRRRYSLAYLTVFGCPPPEMTYIAKRAGYDFVSLRPISMNLPGEPVFDLARDAALLRQTRTALASTGLSVHDIELARIGDGVDVDTWRPALEAGAELGARHVISSIWTTSRSFAQDAYSRLCELARPLGLTIDLEFVTFASLKTLREAVEFLRVVRQPNCGCRTSHSAPLLSAARSRVSTKRSNRPTASPMDLLPLPLPRTGAGPIYWAMPLRAAWSASIPLQSAHRIRPLAASRNQASAVKAGLREWKVIS